MRVLVGCEFSGIVRDAFLERSHDAISCDFRPTERPGPHYQGNVLDLLDGRTHINGKIPKWDLIIMHPDCTALCNAGNKHYGQGKPMYYERLSAALWTAKLWGKCRMLCNKVIFENPPGVLRSMAGLPKPQFIQPYEHGHMEQKRTGLYKTATLPDIEPTDWVYAEMMKLPQREREAVFYMGPSETREMDRARTYPGIAAAWAEQWGSHES